MNHELNYITNNKHYAVIYSLDAKSTLWGVLNLVYNSQDKNKREKITQWHWGLREQIKQISTNFHSISPSKISEDGKVGYYKIGNYGTIECSLLVDTNQHQAIEIRDIYFSNGYINNCLSNNSETFVNSSRPIQKVLPYGNFIMLNRNRGYYIYQHPLTKLLALTNKNGSRYTKFFFTNIVWYSIHNFPKLRLHNVIAIGIDTNNRYWQIGKNFQCKQIVKEIRLTTIDNIISETINQYLKRELIA